MERAALVLPVFVYLQFMAKVKTRYVCQECGTESAQWVGKCPACQQWNTYVEEKFAAVKKGGPPSPVQLSKPQDLKSVPADGQPRLQLDDNEFNRTLGGGLVPGSLILFGGEPGIGKSTLMLQTAMHQKKWTTLYISGEESASLANTHACGYTGSGLFQIGYWC